MTAADASTWSSLAVANLVVAAATPVAVTLLGVFLARSARRVEALQQANQTVVEQRVKVFSEVAGKLNQLLCFATFVGRWKETSAEQALALKRDVDEVMYANRPLFSAELFQAYREFMSCLFAMYATVDGDALIRCQIESGWGNRRNLVWWNPQTEARFAADRETTPEQAQLAYERLTAAFRDDLYVTALTRPLLPPASSPGRR
jgi:hypothetical protein